MWWLLFVVLFHVLFFFGVQIIDFLNDFDSTDFLHCFENLPQAEPKPIGRNVSNFIHLPPPFIQCVASNKKSWKLTWNRSVIQMYRGGVSKGKTKWCKEFSISSHPSGLDISWLEACLPIWETCFFNCSFSPTWSCSPQIKTFPCLNQAFPTEKHAVLIVCCLDSHLNDCFGAWKRSLPVLSHSIILCQLKSRRWLSQKR